MATQLPYAMTVAVVCFANYILASFIQNVVINLAIAIVCMVVVLLVIGKLNHSMNRQLPARLKSAELIKNPPLLRERGFLRLISQSRAGCCR